MQKAIVLLKTSLQLLGQNLGLVYPLLFYLILVDVVFPTAVTTHGPLGEWTWVAWLVLFVLMLSAFSAGWLNMFYYLTGYHRFGEAFRPNLEEEASGREGKKTIVDPETGLFKSVVPEKKSTEPSFQPFRLFQQFVPGVGEHFVPMVLGWTVYFVVMAAIFWVVHDQVMAHGGYPPVLMELMQLGQRGPEYQQELLSRMQSLTLAEQEAVAQLGNRYLVGLLILGLFTLVTLFWSPLVIIRRTNAVEAYWQSVRLVMQHPLPVVFLGLFYLSGFMLMSFVGGLNLMAGMVLWFLWLYVDMTLIIFMFLWVFEHLSLRRSNVDVLA